MLVNHFLENAAARHESKTAIIQGERQVTFGELDTLANRLAHGIVAAGVMPGDRVAICLPNSIEAAVAIFATLKAGAAFVVVHPGTRPAKLAYFLGDTRASALVTDARVNALLHGQERALPHLGLVALAPGAGEGAAVPNTDDWRVVDWGGLMSEARDEPPSGPTIDLDLAGLIYTSGSTGTPKGVMLTHANMVAASTSVASYLGNSPRDVVLGVLPFSFSYGLYQLLTSVQVGASVLIEESFAYPADVLRRVVQHRVTGLPLVPTHVALLLQLDLSRYDLSALRYLTTAGAALPVPHLRRLRELLPHVAVYPMYGQTECMRISYLPPSQAEVRPGSVGIPIPNSDAWIVDEQDKKVGPDEIGELVVRGSHVMRGYWDRPEETRAKLRPGPISGETVLYTGDLFRRDAEGYLYYVSRKDDLIKCRGEKVSPREVENALNEIPGVAEAVVFGVPHPLFGQAVKAVIRPVPGAALSRAEVVRLCRQRLEDHLVPTEVDFIEDLPRTAAGKIDRRALRDGPAVSSPEGVNP